MQSFNGTGAACILAEYVTVEGTRTRNVSSALKMYVDAHPETNYCYWGIGDSEEYYLQGVTGFPVLISASDTKGDMTTSGIRPSSRTKSISPFWRLSRTQTLPRAAVS